MTTDTGAPAGGMAREQRAGRAALPHDVCSLVTLGVLADAARHGHWLTPESLVFGSEIKVILEYPGERAEFRRETLPEYLAFGYL